MNKKEEKIRKIENERLLQYVQKDRRKIIRIKEIKKRKIIISIMSICIYMYEH